LAQAILAQGIFFKATLKTVRVAYSSSSSEDMSMMRALVLATCILSSPVSCADCDGDKNNGFDLSECGSGDKAICCHPSRQVCLLGTPLDGDEEAECSSTRALYGTRFVKVIAIPICALVLLVFLLIHMCKLLKPIKPKPPVAVLCVVQTVLAMLVVLSPVWKFGLYSAFLSALVFHVIKDQQQLPKWAFGIIIALQFFNILAITGAVGTTNGVFIPLGFLAADNVPSWGAGIIDSLSAGAACSGAFENYFDLATVELRNEGADPEQKFHGLCTDSFIGAVNVVVAVKMVIQFIMTALCAKLFVGQLSGQGSGLAEKDAMA